MPRKFNQDIYEVVAALLAADVSVEEITRRLNEGEAGLDHRVPIAKRTVYDYRTRIREDQENEEAAQDPGAHSIIALKQRAIDRIAKEIIYLEKRPAGKITKDQASTLRRLFSALDDMERRELIAQKRRPRSTPKPKDDEERPETKLEELARAAEEGQREPESGSEQ